MKLEFTMVFDHEVEGISDDLAKVSWFAPIGQTICKDFGVVSVEKVRRELKLIEPRAARARKRTRP